MNITPPTSLGRSFSATRGRRVCCLVRFTEPEGDRVRIISARRATRKELHDYEDMSKTDKPKRDNGLRSEYRFDYSKAKPNRFAERARPGCVAVLLDPDVAQVFKSAESVNAVLRALMATMPVAASPRRPQPGDEPKSRHRGLVATGNVNRNAGVDKA